MVAETVAIRPGCVECGRERPAKNWHFTRCGRCQSALARAARKPAKRLNIVEAPPTRSDEPMTGEHPEIIELVVMQRCATELRRLPELARRRALLWLAAAYGERVKGDA